MGELQTEYAGRVDFEIISAEDTAQRGAELDRFGFTDLRHGLVIFDGGGEDQVRLPGHSFDKATIQNGIESVLAGS